MADLFDIVVARKLSGGGGGGGSWTVLTEETVTTTAGEFGNVGELSYGTFISSETIRVTFDGTEYECPRIGGDDDSAYGGIGQSGPDFSEYPFAILSSSTNLNTIYTETAGTYTVKLEEQRNGGSSDFSTAEVTIVNNDAFNSAEGTATGVIYDQSSEWDLPPATLPICTGTHFFSIAPHESATYLVCLYKGHTVLSLLGNVNVSGDAELIDSENGIYDITGDCTITIS